MRKVISRVALLTVTLVACTEQTTAPEIDAQFAATALTINDVFPVSLMVFIPCAAGGAGEDVLMEGYLHSLIHVTANPNGGFTVKTHFQPQGISGTGSVTGDKYQGTGVTQDISTVGPGETFTFVNSFRVIGQKPGNNFLVHQNVHITVNANGVVTTVVDHASVECK